MIDLSQISVTAGNGGNGYISLINEFYRPRGGPDGGDGGKGGDVYITASSSINTLAYFVREKVFKAEDGLRGEKNYRSGRGGEDLYITVPCGTVVHQVDDSDKKTFVADLTYSGDKVLVARGGVGGFGNAHFKSSRLQTPKVATKGKKGQSYTLQLELKLISNVGFIGLPSVGKSSLLNFMVKSSYKTASYPFTTLSPNLGVLLIDKEKSLVLADLPGLIEGASAGKGLGEDFLRHAERCGVLVHILDINNTEEFLSGSLNYSLIADQMYANYKAINNELNIWSKTLSDKPQIVVINKIDLLNTEGREFLLNYFKSKTKKTVILLSSYTGEGVTDLVNYFSKNYKKIIDYSAKQVVKKSSKDDFYEINLLNVPNKRIVEKPGFNFKVDNKAEEDGVE